MSEKSLFEIQIPVSPNDPTGLKYPVVEGRIESEYVYTKAYHEEFEALVIGKVGGMSVLPEILGYWLDEGRMYREKMIPYRIFCSHADITAIAEFAKRHYEQKAIFVAKLGTVTFF